MPPELQTGTRLSWDGCCLLSAAWFAARGLLHEGCWQCEDTPLCTAPSSQETDEGTVCLGTPWATNPHGCAHVAGYGCKLSSQQMLDAPSEGTWVVDNARTARGTGCSRSRQQQWQHRSSSSTRQEEEDKAHPTAPLQKHWCCFNNWRLLVALCVCVCVCLSLVGSCALLGKVAAGRGVGNQVGRPISC
jgi:hypothetical protein